MISSIKSYSALLLDLIFPRYCAVCDAVLAETENHLCIKCFMELPRTGLHKVEENNLEKMYWGRMPIVRASAFMYYKEGFKNAIHNLKYRKNHAIGKYFGQLMAEEISQSSDFFAGIDAIVPIPLHSYRLWKRGYNQSEYIAKGVQEVTQIPVLTDVVIRHRNNQSQTRMTHSERRKNVEDIFRCTHPELLKGKHILLLDDVITSNATTLSCAESIMQAVGTPLPYSGDTTSIRFSILSLAFAGR